MLAVSGVKQNLWRRQQRGLFAPVRRNFPIDGLVLYAPLWHPELNVSPFTSKDLNAHSCSVTGATWGIQGRTFDGVDDYINCGSAASLHFGGTAITVLAWLKPSALTDEQIIKHRDILDAQSGNWQFYLLANGGLYFNFWSGGVNKEGLSTNTGFMSTTSFNFAGVTYDGSNIKHWHQGVQNGNAVAATGTIDTVTFPVLIAARYLAALIGEVYLYSRALSAFEILQIYLSTLWRYV